MNTWGALQTQFGNIGAAPQATTYGPLTPGQAYSPVAIPQYNDPYASLMAQGQGMMNTDAGQASQMSQQAQQQMQSSVNQMQSQYPSYPNQAGAGSQNPYGPGSFGGVPQQSAAPMPGSVGGSDPATSGVPNTSSQGFNPWSLVGEATSRGK